MMLIGLYHAENTFLGVYNSNESVFRKTLIFLYLAFGELFKFKT